MALRPMGFATVRVALHQGARSRGYKLLREGAGPKSLEWWWWLRLLFRLRWILAIVAWLSFVSSLPPLL
jgi:hypothetical protein